MPLGFRAQEGKHGLCDEICLVVSGVLVKLVVRHCDVVNVDAPMEIQKSKLDVSQTRLTFPTRQHFLYLSEGLSLSTADHDSSTQSGVQCCSIESILCNEG